MPSVRLYNSSWEMNRITPYEDRHIKFKLEQIDLTKDVKLFYGHSFEAVEDALKRYCESLAPGQKKPNPDPVKLKAGLHISEISRIGSNPKATQLAEEKTLTMAVIFVEKPTSEGLFSIFSFSFCYYDVSKNF